MGNCPDKMNHKENPANHQQSEIDRDYNIRRKIKLRMVNQNTTNKGGLIDKLIEAVKIKSMPKL